MSDITSNTVTTSPTSSSVSTSSSVPSTSSYSSPYISMNTTVPSSQIQSLKLPVITTNNSKKYWIKIRRNNQYIPQKTFTNKEVPQHSHEPVNQEASEWHLVQSKKKIQKLPIDNPIYYWEVIDHNLFVDKNDKSYKLFFSDPDTTQIENNDQNNYMAIDDKKQLRLIHVRLKHKGMKMTPTYYIARTVKQIEDALHFVKYCVVKIDNNEQKLVDL
jgi:hypothetical protein